MRYTEDEYLDFDPFEGDESEVACRTKKIVKAKKEHACFFGMGPHGDGHTIAPGQAYRYETALIDGSFWGKYRCCTKCLDRYISEMEGED